MGIREWLQLHLMTSAILLPISCLGGHKFAKLTRADLLRLQAPYKATQDERTDVHAAMHGVKVPADQVTWQSCSLSHLSPNITKVFAQPLLKPSIRLQENAGENRRGHTQAILHGPRDQ